MHQTCALSRLRSMVVLGPVLALVLFIGSCGDNPVSPSTVANANLAVMLTDAPIDDVEQVNIYFTSVTAKPEQTGVQRLTLDLAQNPIDLLALTDRSINFAAGVVEPGRYEFMQINIDEGRSYLVENGVRKSLRAPSQEIKVVGGFVVDDDHKTTVTVDFDAADSLVRQGNGTWLLRPIVVITGHNTSSRSR
jgi:hypothetical protein